MEPTYWHRQTAAQPLFPDLQWSRPENRAFAGKLLIVGGHAQSFAAVAEAYSEAVRAGVGTARVLLPDVLQKTVGPVIEAGEFAPSTPSGSFAKKAMSELLSLSEWADAVLLAGDFGRNSETAILLEIFLSKFIGPVTLTKDAVDYFTKSPQRLLTREHTTLVLSLAQLQQIASAVSFHTPITFGMDLVRLAESLHEFTTYHSASIIVKHLQNIFVAVNGQVSTTRINEEIKIWRVRTSALASVWWLQNPVKMFEALSTSIIML